MSSTLKKEIIRAFAIGTDTDVLPGNSVILVTALGLICGTLPPDQPIENQSLDSKVHLAMIQVATQKYQSENEDQTGNGGFLMLQDATILSPNGTLANFGAITIFYDQIIGIAIGKLPNT